MSTRLTLHPDFRHLEAFVRSLPERFSRGEGTLIHDGRNQLRTFTHDGLRLVAKSYKIPHLLNRLVYGFLRPGKARRAYRNSLFVQGIGVRTPQPVAYMEMRSGLLFGKSYYVCLESLCPHVYQELFERKFDYEEEVLRSVGRLTALLHNNGCAHKDYGRGNILFRPTENGVELELVDLNRMDFGPLDIRKGCKNLERLPATPQMHRWLAEEYAKARSFDAEECYRLMVAYRSTQPGKIDGLY